MNVTQLQTALDQTRSTAMQRWVLIIVSIASIVSASAAIARASDVADTWVVFFVAGLAGVVAAEPDEHLGLVLMGIVLFHWITLDQAVTSPWSMALAAALHLFHTTVALMAVTPHTAVVQRDVVVRWAARSVAVAVSTLGVWLLVVAFEQREAPGNVALSAMAFAVLAGAVVAFRSRSVFERA